MTAGNMYASFPCMQSAFVRGIKDLSLPEYRARHIFIAKLRLAIFIGFLCLYVVFLHDYFSETKSIVLVILATFLITTLCYYNVFNDRLLIPSFVLELLADLVAMTAIVHLTGGPESDYYVVYIFYTVAVGIFYDYGLALITAVFSFFSYLIYIFLCRHGTFPLILIGGTGIVSKGVELPYLHPVLLAVFLTVAVYATKIAHVFTQKRERMLEDRNKELLALQRMSSTIRTVTSLDDVLSHVVNGVLEGLNLTLCILMLLDKDEKSVRCIPPDASTAAMKTEEILGIRLKDLRFPVTAVDENPVFGQLRRGQIIFRRDITEIVEGVQPVINLERYRKVQDELDIRRIIAIPMITGRKVIGSLIGFTTEAFVETKKIHTFQAFADQAALAVEAAMLITELREANIELVEANRVKSEFLATMSHELRTPLTSIIGFSELMIEGVMGALTEEQMDSLKEVLSNGNNLLEMINNLLDLAKADSGKMELLRHTFDWGEMLQRIRRSVSPLIKQKGHRLIIETPADLPPVFADEKRMQQIVLNLLSNSIKFTSKGGEIRIRTEQYPGLESLSEAYGFKDLSVDGCLAGTALLACSVEDNGIGIPEEHLPAIFDVFQQVDSSETKSYEGSGLGLALVKQFVKLHGGLVWVKSRVGKGTTISFAFPFS